MYIQITTRCNMSCGHCCFACRPGFGNDMDEWTFQQSLNLAAEWSENISLGGGEPTIHPQFWKWFRRARQYNDAIGSGLAMFMATNGSITRTALRLAKLVEQDIESGGDPTLDVVLSLDYWHDPIDPRVVEAFTRIKKRGREGIRSNEQITKHGSAIANNCYTEEDACCCHDVLVHPSGRLYGCGCRKFSLGTVFSHQIPEGYQPRECMVQWRKEQAA